jgi:hypothetical protein
MFWPIVPVDGVKVTALTARSGEIVAPTKLRLVAVEFVANAGEPLIKAELNVAKLPEELAKLKTSNDSSRAGAKPLVSVAFNVPPSAAAPETLS